MSAHSEDILVIDGHPSGNEVIQTIKAESPTVMLAFSCGKDSIAAWLRLREFGVKVIPFYFYLIPGLSFVEDSLAYYESSFETKIHQLPNPALYRMWNSMVFTPPERCRHIEASTLPNFTREQALIGLKDWLKMPQSTFTATGVRCADSINRRRHFVTHGAINRTSNTFYPIWDMRMTGLLKIMVKHQIKVPIDYSIFGRSFDGLDFRFLKPIKDHFPNDYAKILEYFPLAELELKRHEYAS